ncbi:ABC-three component system protein [Nonomuraea sp. NPDC049714]|uniref:ABC-three component system protein n=1 Tax=Nonomuraea sp. NPDC049714 TaxID=3364357 RepID=UPI003789F30D
MSSLEQWERSSIRFMLAAKLGELHGQTFQDFFQAIMCARYPTFIDVRAHGNIGDLSSDGLRLHDRKLYACYGAEGMDASAIKRKLKSDLQGAVEKRSSEFDTFVFVHNDHKGMHPEVSRGLAEQRNNHPEISFENFGHHRFYNELCRLERWQIEDLLGPFPAKPVVTSVVLGDLIPLLDHLAEHRRPFDQLPEVPEPPVTKMDYNGFSPDAKHRMRTALPYVQHVETFYAGRLDPNERDETAAGFRDYYEMVAAACDDPDEVLWYLECHILGNATPAPKMQLNALVILMYFFGECDIFKVPPPGWTSMQHLEVMK